MSMQKKESIMVVRCELKIPSLGMTIRHHEASLVMPNSYPRDRTFNRHLTTIKDSYILMKVCTHFDQKLFSHNVSHIQTVGFLCCLKMAFVLKSSLGLMDC